MSRDRTRLIYDILQAVEKHHILGHIQFDARTSHTYAWTLLKQLEARNVVKIEEIGQHPRYNIRLTSIGKRLLEYLHEVFKILGDEV